MLFRHPPSLPSNPVDYPAGVFVQTEKGYFYISSPSKRFRCISARVVESWAPPRIVETTEAACSNFRIVAKLKFRNGSLLRSVADGKMYFISEGKRRHVVSIEALSKIGAGEGQGRRSLDTMIRVSLDEINLHEEGAPLT